MTRDYAVEPMDDVGPYDPEELVRWADSYGHPEQWAKRAQQAHGKADRRLEALHRAVVLFDALGHDGTHGRCDPCEFVRQWQP